MIYKIKFRKNFKSMTGSLKGLVAILIMFLVLPIKAQNKEGYTEGNDNEGRFELFGENLPPGTSWTNNEEYVRNGGNSKKSNYYLYIEESTSPAEITGLSIPIRENPGPGEYRYITFSWIKWGGDQIGMKFDHEDTENTSGPGENFNYTYASGEGDKIVNALTISKNVPGNWTIVTRDLWKDFGDFTLTGVSFICPERRDAGFDAIFLGQTEDVFEGAPGILPTSVAEPVDVEAGEDMSLDEDNAIQEDSEEPEGISIDWAAQVKAGGWMMYPLYLLGLAAIVIAVQRILTSRESRLAPKELRTSVREHLSRKDFAGAIEACNKYPSTLAESLKFIFLHRHAGMEVVSQTSGDIAARDIREHLNRIYPLSVIASLSPLLGLLGTIVGMIEAFGLVAMYGDEGGAAILSDAISKALITTAAGLIIAAPAVAIYFMIKKRIMGLSSIIEVEIENAITEIYLQEDSTEPIKSKTENHAHTI